MWNLFFINHNDHTLHYQWNYKEYICTEMKYRNIFFLKEDGSTQKYLQYISYYFVNFNFFFGGGGKGFIVYSPETPACFWASTTG